MLFLLHLLQEKIPRAGFALTPGSLKVIFSPQRGQVVFIEITA